MPVAMGNLTQRYALDRVIGRGASGSVWVAEDLKLGRRVAIKQLDRQLAEDLDACTRFEREAWTIAQLRSPHIVQVYDSGVESGVPFIVMELLHGESLEDRLARYRDRTRMPLRVATSIIADVARGLSTSHAAGIVHRDLKPGNVFLARENRREIAKLLDFGIAAIAADAGDRSGHGILAGTPQFMSPEHFEGQPLDGHADLWSLAVMAYQLLTGRLPFVGPTLRDLRAQICGGALPAPSELVPELGPSVDRVFERALAKKADERYPSAAELAVALEELASDRSARPVTRVLFVDDEADMETLLRQRLRREVNAGRYDLFFARSADEGLKLLATCPDIDVVFADVNMPEKGPAGYNGHERHVGREGLAFLVQVPEVNPIVRVVMLSAHYENRAYVRLAMNHGAYDFLGKPIDFADLRQTIDKCAADARALRELVASHHENELLRSLIGRPASDRLVAEARAADGTVTNALQASVALLSVPRTPASPPSESAQALFARLNAHFDLFLPEVHGRQGSVYAIEGNCMVALFQGPEHSARAVDACLAAVERARMTNGLLADGAFAYVAAAVVGTGTVYEGRLGSALAGRVEHCLLGAPMEEATELKNLCAPFEILITRAVQDELSAHYRSEADSTRRMSDGTALCRVLGPRQPGADLDAIHAGETTTSVPLAGSETTAG